MSEPTSAGGPRPDGPPRNRREALRAVAASVGGTFVEGKMLGGYAVVLEHGPWTLTMDLHLVNSGFVNTIYTRVLAFFSGREDVRLSVRPCTFFDSVADRVGLGPPILGGRELARRYVVRGRPESRARSLLGGGLADVLLASGPLRLGVKRAPWGRRRSMGPHARQVQVLAPGVDTDVDRMVGLFRTARETLDVLARTGAASSEPPR